MLFRRHLSAGDPPKQASGNVARALSRAGDDVEEFFERTIEQNGTIFGRLVSLASLWNPPTDRYRHPVLERVLLEKEMDCLIRTMHGKVFFRWLSLDLAQQRGDLIRYVGHDSAADDSFLCRLWDRDALVAASPPELPQHEKELFATDLLVVIQSILRDYRTAPA